MNAPSPVSEPRGKAAVSDAQLMLPPRFKNDYPGVPDEWTEPMRTRAETLLDRCRQRFPDYASVLDPGVDVEDFWEDACRVSAAVDAAESVGTTLDVVRLTEDNPSWTPEQMARRLSGVSSREEDRHRADPLLNHPLMQHEYAGRAMQRCGFYDSGDIEHYGGEPDDTMIKFLGRRAAAGHSQAVIKVASSKGGVAKVDTSVTLDELAAILSSQLDWTFIRLSGAKGAFLVQDWVPMTYEYRLFVVDGTVVSGAGCVEEFTPLHRLNLDGAFDPQMRRWRGALSGDEWSEQVETREDLMGRYRRAAETMLHDETGTFTLDLALDADSDRVVVVELNALPNSGLYASDPKRVYAALVTAKDRGYGWYPWRQQQLIPAQSKPKRMRREY